MQSPNLGFPHLSVHHIGAFNGQKVTPDSLVLAAILTSHWEGCLRTVGQRLMEQREAVWLTDSSQINSTRKTNKCTINKREHSENESTLCIYNISDMENSIKTDSWYDKGPDICIIPHCWLNLHLLKATETAVTCSLLLKGFTYCCNCYYTSTCWIMHD